jgi:pyruvate,orthophosphate dikinase
MAARKARIGNREVAEGDLITLDGSTGEIMAGEVPMVEPELVGDFATLMVWADKHRRMKVRTNAETPLDCQVAASSAPKASACAAPSTCSSRPGAFPPCAR